jgi:phospholipid/cholesterol/gamma-HCH transport system substrate-binding protein
MTVKDGVKIPADARAIIISPNLVAARFVQFTPAYDGGAALGNGAEVPLSRTGVPVEWDDVKKQLTQLSAQLGPQDGAPQGPLGAFINQAADTLDGNGDSFRSALRELSQTAGRLGDSRGDLFGTIKNLQILVNALSNSNEQIVQFTDHVASVSQVLAESSAGLDQTLGALNQALGDVKGLLKDNIEQVLHVTPNGLANFYNIYNPAQGSLDGLLSLPNFSNPVQFLCGGNFDVGATPDNYKRAEICRQRMGPVLRRIAMNYPPVLFHPINSITAYKGQLIYDTPQTEAKAQTPVPYLQWNAAPGVTPPKVQPDGTLSDLILPPPAVPGQISPATPPVGPGSTPLNGSGPLPGPAPAPAAPVGAPLPAEAGGGN